MELVLNLNLISLDVNSVTLLSKSSSKLVSTRRLSFGSSNVIFDEAGELFITNDAPFWIASETPGLFFILIFKFSVKVKMYFSSWSTPAATFISNELFCPVTEWFSFVFSIDPDIILFKTVSSDKLITGEVVLEKSMFPIPFDSTLFNIPSLSWSRSILSIIPSLSKSSGHWLIGISDEKYSAVSPSQEITAFTLYVPISEGVNCELFSPLIDDHVSSVFFFCHSRESKFPLFDTSKTTFDVPELLIHDPNFDAVSSKLRSGLEANPEKKLPEAAAPFWLK